MEGHFRNITLSFLYVSNETPIILTLTIRFFCSKTLHLNT